MARLTANVIVAGEDGSPVALLTGDEVPAWAESQVGEHVLEPEKPTAKRSAKSE